MDSVLRIVEVYQTERIVDSKTREVLAEEVNDDPSFTLVDLFEDGEVSGGYEYFDSYEEAEALKKELDKEKK